MSEPTIAELIAENAILKAAVQSERSRIFQIGRLNEGQAKLIAELRQENETLRQKLSSTK